MCPSKPLKQANTGTMHRKISYALFSLIVSIVFIQACKKSAVSNTTTTPTVSAITCSATSFSVGTATANTAYTGTATVPYTGGNGVGYGLGTAIASTGVTGLTATLQSGTLASGAGNFSYSISGTPTSSGTATFNISFGGQSCSISLTVNPAATTNCATQTGFAKLLCLCDAFKATLTASQLATAQLAYTYANIKTWSNLPASMSARIGIPFSSLNSTQLAAAKAIVQEMSGTTANEGWSEVQQLWLADDYLLANGGGSAYGAGNYYLAFFGTPATTGQFEIMMTGHHKTVANTYKDGALVAATPHFAATEPLSWSTGGTTYGPLNQEQAAFAAIVASLTTTQYSTAHTATTFGDLVLTPSANWAFPLTSVGLKCSSLTTAQKDLVLNAIKTYVNDVDDANAAKILATYTTDLDNTYILHSGTNAMNTKSDYFRIDGPRVWIEFSVQNGIVLSGVHYHSVWRDRISDYGTTKQ